MRFEIQKSSSLPLHIQLLDELRHKVMTGIFRPHDRLPGETELASDLDISRATIQKAWASAEEEGLIYRVMGKGTFIAEPRARSSVRVPIGLIVPDFRGTFAVHMLSGVERILSRAGYQTHLASSDYTIERENEVLERMQADGTRGAILWGMRANGQTRIIPQIASTMPLVLIDRPLDGMQLPCVASHSYMGGQQAMEHLIERGHQRIAFVARPHLDLWPVAERYRAYRDALTEAGLDALPPVLIGDEYELSSYTAYRQADMGALAPLAALLTADDRPTAIFAVNDWMAMRVLRAAQDVGLRVPDDLSVIGFDNLDLDDYLTPPLTSVAQDTELIGAEAARRLITLIEGEPVRDILTLVPTRLVVRNSVAAPSQQSGS